MFTVPAVEEGRYYSLQFIDMYTFNFAYVGSRAMGNEAANFLLAGPKWKGETPLNIKDVIRSETDFVFVLYRTQLLVQTTSRTSRTCKLATRCSRSPHSLASQHRRPRERSSSSSH